MLGKMISAVSTPAAEAVGKVVEAVGKTSVLTGGVVYATDRVVHVTWSMAEYAAMVSIVGGLVWITKNLFDMLIVYLKYRRGD
jgi:hypothetical protein